MPRLRFRADGSFPIACRMVSTTTSDTSKTINSPSLTSPECFTSRRQRDMSTWTRTATPEAEGHGVSFATPRASRWKGVLPTRVPQTPFSEAANQQEPDTGSRPASDPQVQPARTNGEQDREGRCGAGCQPAADCQSATPASAGASFA